MNKFGFTFSIFLMGVLVSSLYAQGTIRGVIKDQDGSPLVAANVVIQKTTNGTVSDIDGNYELTNVSAGQTNLVFSYTGFETTTKSVEVQDGQVTTLDVVLKEDVSLLEEVVVIGYGTKRRREVVGNVAKLDAEKLNDQAGHSFETALQGKSAGIQLVQSSGAAGAASVIRIRGIGSISAGGDPLIVVDGVPISQDYFLNGERNGQNNNPLNSINPNDIESGEVLKDAASAAIYGSRGGNGVILITTKRGKNGKPQFSYSTKMGISRPSNVIDVLDKDQWLQVQQEAWENDGNVGRFELPNGLTYDDIANIDTEWIPKTIQTGFKQEHNLSMRQGNEWLSSYVGVSYSKAESYLRGNSFERISGRVNLDVNILKNLKASVSSSVARGLNFKVPQAWSGGLGWAQSEALPIYPVYKNEFPESSAQYEEEGFYNIYKNPVAQRELTDYRTREWRSISNIQLNYNPISGLSFVLQGNYDYTDLGDYEYEQAEWTQSDPFSKAYLHKIKNYSGFFTGQYTLPISNKDHNVEVLVGSEYQRYDRDKIDKIEVAGLPDHLYEVDGFKDFVNTAGYIDDESYKFFSFFSRLNYTFQKKYLIQLTYRRDGSSRFGANKRFGNFPAVGIGYIISEEPWFNRGGIVNFLKLKGSWGITGNSNIPGDEQFATFKVNNFAGLGTSFDVYYNYMDTKYQLKLANPDLQWEVVKTVDVGMEIGLLNDRFTAELAYYHKLTTDALLKTALQASTGFDDLDFFQNVGKIRNQGVEFSFTSNNITGNNFNWSTEFNLAANRNKVLDVGTATPDALNGGFGDIRVILGEPVGTNFIVPFSHIDPETGRPVYIDIEGNETSEYNVAEDRTTTGNIHPKFLGGITNTFKYQNFDLSFLFVYSFGGKIYDDAAKRQLGVITPDWNFRPEIFDRWRQPNDDTEFPKYSTSMLNWGGNDNPWQNNQSLWLYNASYVRLRNLTFGYNIPMGDKSFIKHLRIYFTGTNLLTFTDFQGWDPEISRGRENAQERNVGGSNVTYLTPPQEKAFVFGLNVDF